MTTSATGNRKYGSCRSGFSIIELLLVIALIALLGSVAVVSQNSFFGFKPVEALENQLSSAVQECRYQALQGTPAITLAYDKDSGFQVRSQAQILKCYPIHEKAQIAEIVFQQVLPLKGDSKEQESKTISKIPFDSDGFTFPFAVSYKVDSDSQTLYVDPLSSALFTE